MKTLKNLVFAVLLPLAFIAPAHALDYALFVKVAPEAWVPAKDGAVAGVAGSGRIADAFKLGGLPFPADFRLHASKNGWLGWTPCDGRISTAGGRTVEAIQFRIPGGLPAGKGLYGRVHLGDKGWQKTVSIENLTVLGTNGLKDRVEAIQLSYVEGDRGSPADRVKNAEALFNRHLPASGQPAGGSSSEYAAAEPGMGRWIWSNTSREFALEAGGTAVQAGRQGKWTLATPGETARTYRIDWVNGNGSTSTDTMTVTWDGHLMHGQDRDGNRLTASRVDGLSQERTADDEATRTRLAEIEWKLESLILPKVAMNDAKFGDAIDWFRLKCAETDRDEADPTKRGFNVVVMPPAGFAPPKVNLAMENAHAGKVLGAIAEQAGLTVKAEAFALVLLPKEKPPGIPALRGKAAEDASEIIIPVVAFEGTRLSEAVDFLKRRSAELAKAQVIVIGTGADLVIPELHLRNVPLPDVLRYVAAISRQPLVAEEGSFVIGNPRQEAAAAPPPAPVPDKAVAPPADGPRIDPAVGAWAWHGGKTHFIIEPDGTITQPPRRGRWTRRNPGQMPARYEFHWAGERPIDSMTLDASGNRLDGTNQFRAKLFATRLGPPMPDAHPDSVMPDKLGFRKWTDTATGRQFEGKMMDKKADGSKALIARKDTGRSVWLDADKLSAVDRFYITHWINADDQVKAKLTAHGHPGWKRVKAVIRAGPEPLLVRVTGQKPAPHPQIAGLPRPPFTLIVPTGQTLEFEFASGTKYAVEATANGRPVCRQEDMDKEGL